LFNDHEGTVSSESESEGDFLDDMFKSDDVSCETRKSSAIYLKSEKGKMTILGVIGP
jgi:hypothetical protein